MKMNKILYLFSLLAISTGEAELPEAVIQKAIEAHGGQGNLIKTLTGCLTAKAKLTTQKLEMSVSWEETFQLPTRYYRRVRGKQKGKETSLEYAVTDGAGWIRQNDDQPKELKNGQKLPLYRTWNAFLANLPNCLAQDVKLSAGEKEKVNGREVIGVLASGDAVGGNVVLFFDTSTGLLVKSKGTTSNPLLGNDVEVEVVYSEFKKVSGIEFPHKIISYVKGQKALDIEITHIEFTKDVPDKVFQRP